MAQFGTSFFIGVIFFFTQYYSEYFFSVKTPLHCTPFSRQMSSCRGCSSIPVYIPVDPNALPMTNTLLGSMASGVAAAGLNLAMQRPTAHPRVAAPAHPPPAGKRRKRRMNRRATVKKMHVIF